MNDFRKQVKDIKFWNYWVWGGLIVLLLSDVPMLIVLMLGVFFGITFNMPKFILEFMMNMFLIGPFLGGLLIIMGVLAVKKRKICSCFRCFCHKKLLFTMICVFFAEVLPLTELAHEQSKC